MNNKIYKEREVNNYRELLEQCSKIYGEKVAFSYKKNKEKSNKITNVTYLEYEKDVKKLGTALLNMNLKKEKIGIISPDRYEWCVSYLAIANSGNIVVPLDHGLTEREIRNSIKRSEAKCILFDKKYEEIIKGILNENETKLEKAICFDYIQNEDNIYSYGELLQIGEKLLEVGNKDYDNIEIDKDEMSILIFTSGTTSNSKAVMLSQYNICSNITAMTSLIKAKDENDNILVFLPLHHTLACTASFLFCFYSGFKICFADSLKNIAKNMKEYEIRGLVCVPAVLELMYKKAIKEMKKQNKYTVFKIMSVITNLLYKMKIDIRRKVFKSVLDGFGGYLRIVIYGSASTKREIVKFFTTIGIDMMQGYGLTETSPVIACESDKNHNNMKSTGYPLYNESVKIQDKDESGIGEIAVKGPNVMMGYYKDEEETKKSIKNGWFYTGDLGYFDKKGKLFITGRKKDIIVLKNGKKVNPEEVEKLVDSSEYIEESFVYGKLEQDGDYKICAKLVYSKDNDELKNKTEKEIYDILDAEIKRINKAMPVYKYIKEITITDENLIRTTTGKIKRFEELKK